MTDEPDYKEAYLTLMRASEQAVRGLETLQVQTANVMLTLIRAQQRAEESLLSQEDETAADP